MPGSGRRRDDTARRVRCKCEAAPRSAPARSNRGPRRQRFQEVLAARRRERIVTARHVEGQRPRIGAGVAAQDRAGDQAFQRLMIRQSAQGFTIGGRPAVKSTAKGAHAFADRQIPNAHFAQGSIEIADIGVKQCLGGRARRRLQSAQRLDEKDDVQCQQFEAALRRVGSAQDFVQRCSAGLPHRSGVEIAAGASGLDAWPRKGKNHHAAPISPRGGNNAPIELHSATI